MKNKIVFEFWAQLWQYAGPNAWYFISLPADVATEIRANLKWQEEGWGRMKATARIGQSEWDTAIWFDTKRNTYILPIKALIRTNEGLKLNEDIQVLIGI
jgi:hypothetical protein